MSLRVHVSSPKGSAFASDTFQHLINQMVTLRVGRDRQEVAVLLMDAAVADDGGSAELVVDAELALPPFGVIMSAGERPRMEPVAASVPVVYAWSTTSPSSTLADQQWVAVCDDGELMAAHVSSSREFGRNDVHLKFSAIRATYRLKFGGLGEGFYRFVVVPEGMRPPLAVTKANEAWAARRQAELKGEGS